MSSHSDWYVDSTKKKVRPNITEEFAAKGRSMEAFNVKRIITPPPEPIEALNHLSKNSKPVVANKKIEIVKEVKRK